VNANAKVFAHAARTTWKELSARRFTPRHRLSETLAVALFARELIKLEPRWLKSLWLETRPFAPESKERVDVWIDWKAARSPLAVEVKVGDPAFPHANGRFATRGGIISDVAKLASALRHGKLGYAYALYFGRADYLRGQDLFSRLAAKTAAQQTIVALARLPANQQERQWSYIEDWLEPQHETPRRVGLRLLARQEKHDLGFWLWQVGLP